MSHRRFFSIHLLVLLSRIAAARLGLHLLAADCCIGTHIPHKLHTYSLTQLVLQSADKDAFAADKESAKAGPDAEAIDAQPENDVKMASVGGPS